MQHPRRDALVRRQQQLMLRSAELRVSLAHQIGALRSPLALADRLRAGTHWLWLHPAWPLAALTWWVLRKPRRMLLRWVPPVVAGWQLFQRARQWLDSRAARNS